MFIFPVSFGWVAHLKIQEKNISVQDKAEGFVGLFFFSQQSEKIFTFSSHSKLEWKPKQNRSQRKYPRNLLCCVPLILFFTGCFTGLVFILFWKGDKYWNLFFSPQKRLFHLSLFLTRLRLFFWKRGKEIIALNTDTSHPQSAFCSGRD